MTPGPASRGSRTLQVRRAGASDVALLADLGARTFVEAFGPDNDPQDIERYVAESFSEERIATDLADPGSSFLVAYDDTRQSEPVAYAHLRAGSSEAGVDGARPVELARIYVVPEAIGRRYGSALLAACLEEAARGGFDVIWLGVWERNDRARRFYERWGFRRVGEHSFVLGTDLQTDHVMARPVVLG